MLRDDIEQYSKLTGEDGWHVPVMKVGAYLDGYNKGLEVIDKIRAEIMSKDGLEEALEIIDKYKAEMYENGIDIIDYDIRQMMKDGIIISRNLCDSCINNSCIFQSGIVRNHCDFYKAESEE